MVKTGKLIYQHPNKPAHPQQAYKAHETSDVEMSIGTLQQKTELLESLAAEL